MQNTFFEKSGENAELLSDLGLRFQTVASELFNIACFGDFALRQAFVQTAGGEYLDKHAAMRNMQRKTAAKASGEITFYAAEEVEEDIEIPENTICSASGREYIQFRTTQAGIIPVGEASITLPAEALENGSVYNVKAGDITVLVNPPGYVDRIENAFDFSGGWDDESDESLRKRLLASYSVPPTGFSRKSIAECIMKLDGVLDCNVIKRSANTLDVCVKTKNSAISEELEAAIENALLVAEITISRIDISQALRREYELKIAVTPLNGDGQNTAEKIRAAVKNYTDGIRIGESVNLAEVYHLASHTAAIKDCTVSSPDATDGIIDGTENSYLVPYEITVECYE